MYRGFTKELALLNNNYKNNKFSCVLLYGRIGIGKTTLIREYIKNKYSIYFFVKPQTIDFLLKSFKNIVADFFDDEVLKLCNIRDLTHLFEIIAKKEFTEKLVIVFDEFQTLIKLDSSIAKQLKYIIEEILISKNIEIILSGSNLSLIDKQVISKKSLLHENITLSLKLEQMCFTEASLFLEESYSSKSDYKDDNQINQDNIFNSSLIEIYAILGGTRKYLNLYKDSNKTISDFIENSILDKNSYLYNEIESTLHNEVNELAIYNSILEAIASDIHKIGDIALTIAQSVQNITAPIAKLISLGIISKSLPVTEENRTRSKMGLYFINDNFFRFWFRYVFPYKNHLELGNVEFVMDKIKDDWNNFIAPVYRSIAIEYMDNRFNTGLELQWWDKSSRIDIITLDNGFILFAGDSFYSNEDVSINNFRDLEEKVEFIKNHPIHNDFQYLLFSNHGFTDELQELSSEMGNIFLILLES